MEGLLQVGRYWTKLYLKSKPWAEIPDESCLREGCHDKRLLEGETRYNKIVFDHTIHLTDLQRGKLLRCTSCHSQIVQGEHITVTQSSCFICHFKKSEHYPQIADCYHCHKEKDLGSSTDARFNHQVVFQREFDCLKCHTNTIIGDGSVPQENCYKCHWEQDRLDKYSETDLMHLTHISENKIECNLCHLEIQHKIVTDIETISDCTTCHQNFHQAQKILYAGEGGKGIPHAMSNIMFERGLSCKGCHLFHEESEGKSITRSTFISSEEACESCHGTGFGRILKEWKQSTEKKLKEINSIYFRAVREIKTSRSGNKDKADELLNNAGFNIDLVEKGKSVHNVQFSRELLLASYRMIKEALLAAGSSYTPPEISWTEEPVPSECSNCHSGIEEISSLIFGFTFSHENHIIGENLICGKCHSHLQRHGELLLSRTSCVDCHHQEQAKDCVDCHQIQALFYQGGNLEDMKIPADFMNEAGVGCSDCHGQGKNIIRPGPESCSECHESEYQELHKSWQAGIEILLNNLRNSIEEEKKLAKERQNKEWLNQAEKILHTVEKDCSLGIHNFIWMEDILTQYTQKKTKDSNLK